MRMEVNGIGIEEVANRTMFTDKENVDFVVCRSFAEGIAIGHLIFVRVVGMEYG